MEEIWKDVAGDYAAAYQVSNFGRIKRKAAIIKRKNNSGLLPISERILAGEICQRGGYRVVKASFGGRRKNIPVHRWVALTFIPNPENKREVNHIDFDRLNNRVDNLEWVNSKENVHHSMAHGRFDQRNKLNFKKATWIRNLKKTGEFKNKELAWIFDVTETTVSYVLRRKVWDKEIILA